MHVFDNASPAMAIYIVLQTLEFIEAMSAEKSRRSHLLLRCFVGLCTFLVPVLVFTPLALVALLICPMHSAPRESRAGPAPDKHALRKIPSK